MKDASGDDDDDDAPVAVSNFDSLNTYPT